MGSISDINGAESFTLKEEPVENHRPMKVVIVGAGFSGIYTTIRISQRLKNIDLTVYEMNEDIAGVWWANRYPGLACDIPSYCYQFSFAPNPYWSAIYAPGPEIRQYMQDVAERYGATRYIKTSHKVEATIWEPENNLWRITVTNRITGERIEQTADLVISARGSLNQIVWPQIPGLKDFQGKLMHSAAWDESQDLRNKRVGVIGNGSSAIQIVPAIQPLEGLQLWTFVRSPTWISASFGDMAVAEMGMDPADTKFTRKHQEAMARNPEQFFKYRKTFENSNALTYATTLKGSKDQLEASLAIEQKMREKLEGRKDILEAILPKFAPGCRRLTPGPGYLEALNKENVKFITTLISSVTSKGIKLASGEEIGLDVIVCATGFDVEAPPTFEVVGRSGISLADKWKPQIETYLSLAVDQFPNFLIIGGPGSGLGSGSLVSLYEAQGDYIVKAIRKMQKEDYATMEVRPERVADFGQFIDEYFKRTVYSDDCTSWYKHGNKSGRIVALWPGAQAHCLEVLRSPRWKDYVFQSADPTGNLLRWMGNGWSTALQKGGDPSWFLDDDVVDAPKEGKPEEDTKYQRRPFTY